MRGVAAGFAVTVVSAYLIRGGKSFCCDDLRAKVAQKGSGAGLHPGGLAPNAAPLEASPSWFAPKRKPAGPSAVRLGANGGVYAMLLH